MPSADRPDRMKVPVSSSEPDVVTVFKDVVTAMSVANSGNRLWWYTWLASRDRFNAALWKRLCVLSSSVEKDKERQPKSPVFTRSFADRIKTTRRLIAEVVWFAKWRHAERKVAYLEKVDVILVTHLETNSFKDGCFRDIYFGKLCRYLNDKGERVFVCGMLQGDPAKVLSGRDEAEIDFDGFISSFGAFIKVLDFFKALIESLFNQIKIIDFELPFGGNAKLLLADDIRNAIPDMFHGRMIELASARMLKHFPSARVIHIYENNPWEHAVDRQAFLHKRQVIGFLHCAVLPSHLKNYISEVELNLRPSPDRTVCTGAGARDIFLALGRHDPEKVMAGCDLRSTLPQDRSPRREHRKSINNVLVVLEAIPSMVGLLKFMDTVAAEFSNISFYVRAHPALPLSELAAKAEIKCHPRGCLIESKEQDLIAAMEAADVIIYQGTTVAMTAVYLGIPVIKVENKDPIEDDPLFEIDHLKWRVKDLDEIIEAFTKISKLDQDIFIQERDQARSYAENYFAPPTDEIMSVFLKVEQITSE